MTPEPDLQRMLTEAYGLERGPARWAALDAVFRHADAAGNAAFGFRARMSAISDLHHGGEYARVLTAFSWCLATFDRQPELTTGYDAHQLLWQYKWVVWEITQFPGVPLDRATGLLDDMQRRYQEGGHSLHAVFQHRGLVAQHLGDLAGASRWYGEMLTARRDALSDCAACVPSGHVAHLVAAGRYEEAVEVGSPYANGGCTEQPHWMLSELLMAYLRTGRIDEAVQGHKRAYERIRDSRHHLELIGLNLEFCGLSGNERHALPIVERHLPWLDRPSSPYAALEFASGAALVLRRLAERGDADAPIHRSSDDGTRHWVSTVGQTHDELAVLARKLAAEFDARNGNDHHGRRIEARLAAAPIVEELPLTVLSGRPIAPARGGEATAALVRKVADLTAAGDREGAARTQLEVAYALRNAAQWGDAIETAEEAQRSLDGAGLTEDAMSARYLLVELYGRSNRRHLVAALVDELLAAESLPPSVPAPAALLEQTINAMDWSRAVDQLVRAADLHRAADDPGAELRCLRKALPRLFEASPAAEALLARLDALVAAGHVPAAELPDLQARLSRVLEQLGDLDGALARVEPHPFPLRKAHLLLRLGRAVEAEEVARPSLEDGDEDVAWTAAVLLTRSLRAQSRDAEAEALMEEYGVEDYALEEHFDPGDDVPDD
ncbi:hypothetical protein ACFFX1_41480 [Dactylosporangium sucinum]|uniref:Tetratricopeptide repeat protein n=1 Tax=Dactylosporangium sucinum TaxID=1424081 RepID=A0A917U6P7_9ACTN|nr:hypothetical protein [Dactylosporangium sucinum]GGM59469.1 hypothetical protein GCM10007977_071280 [Dactylosporangium sucinum]